MSFHPVSSLILQRRRREILRGSTGAYLELEVTLDNDTFDAYTPGFLIVQVFYYHTTRYVASTKEKNLAFQTLNF